MYMKKVNYTAEANRVTYEKLIEAGRALLTEGGGVILDATFRSAADRDLAGEMATRAEANFRVVECRLAPDLVRSRLERRAARKETLSDATWATYLHQCQEFDPIGDSAAAWHLSLDTTHAISVTTHTATDWLRGDDRKARGAQRDARRGNQ
jgi:predicted kinase